MVTFQHDRLSPIKGSNESYRRRMLWHTSKNRVEFGLETIIPCNFLIAINKDGTEEDKVDEEESNEDFQDPPFMPPSGLRGKES